MTQSKMIGLWIAAMLALGGVYFYATWRATGDRCDCASCRMARDNPDGAMNLEPALTLGAMMPSIEGHWVTPDEKGPELKGNVVLLDFWGTFCAPCIAAIPGNNRIFEKFAPQGFVLAGVSTDSKIALSEFKKTVEVRYPLLASDSKTFAAYQIEFTPSTFLFDRGGKLVWKGVHLENQDGSINASFEKALLQALGTPNAAPASTSGAAELPADFQKLLDQAKAQRAIESAGANVVGEPGLKLGATLPELRGDWLTPTGSAPDLKGKVVLIDFFTTVCGSCVESIPVNNTLYAQYAPRGFVFAFASPEPKALVQEFMAGFPKKIEYPVLSNANALFESCAVKTLPTTHLFGRDGKLLWKGGLLEKDGKLDAEFAKVLNDALAAATSDSIGK